MGHLGKASRKGWVLSLIQRDGGSSVEEVERREHFRLKGFQRCERCGLYRGLPEEAWLERKAWVEDYLN